MHLLLCIESTELDPPLLHLFLQYWAVDERRRFAKGILELAGSQNWSTLRLHREMGQIGFAVLRNCCCSTCHRPFMWRSRSGCSMPPTTNRRALCLECAAKERERDAAEQAAELACQEAAEAAAVERFNQKAPPTSLVVPNLAQTPEILGVILLSAIEANWDGTALRAGAQRQFTSHPKLDRIALSSLWEAELIKPLVERFEQLKSNRIHDSRAVRWMLPWYSDYELDLAKRGLRTRIADARQVSNFPIAELLRLVMRWEVAAFIQREAQQMQLKAGVGPKLLAAVDHVTAHFSPPFALALGRMAVNYLVIDREKGRIGRWDAGRLLPAKLEVMLNWARTKRPNSFSPPPWPYRAGESPELTKQAFEAFFDVPITASTFLGVDWNSLYSMRPPAEAPPPAAWLKTLFQREADDQTSANEEVDEST